MTVKFKYNIAQPDISSAEVGYVMEALSENELSGHGRHVKLFEEKFAKFIGSEFALACPNGTITLHLILAALGIGKGDEVILPSQTISNCLTEGTYVETKREGKFLSIPIEMVHVGDEVLSYNEKTGEKEWDKVAKTSKRFSDKVFTVKLSNGNEIYATDEHPVYVVNKGWTMIKDLKVGDEVIQYVYQYLNTRIRQLSLKGKTLNEILGDDRANDLKKTIGNNTKDNWINGKFVDHGKKIKTLYGDNKSKYNDPSGNYRTIRGKKISDGWKNMDPLLRKKLNDTSYISNLSGSEKDNFYKKVAKNMRENNPMFRKEISSKVSETKRERWKNDIEFKSRMIKIFAKKPNLEEIQVYDLIDNWLPNEYALNVLGDEQVKQNANLGKYTPDYLSRSGKKKIIEFNGCDSHCCEICGVTKNRFGANVDFVKKYDDEKIKIYNENGYDTLVIWEHELSNLPLLETKVKNFTFNPNTEVVKVVSVVENKANNSIGHQVYNLETEKNHNFFAYGVLVHNCIYVVSLTGATPVVVDVDPSSWCMDPSEFEKAVTDKTKAVMPVHLFGGIPANMAAINKIAKKNKITVIEDCAESIGSKYGGKMTGNIGDVASFSLFANKTIMTGEGGIITTNDKKLFERMKYLRNVAYGTDPETKFWANDMGFNYRPSNLVCALGLGQLDRVDYLMKRRNEIHQWYIKYISTKFVWQKPYPNSDPCCWMNAILVPENINRSFMMKYLIKNGIETRPTFPPLGQHPYLKKKGYGVRSLGEKVSIDIWNRGLLLPSAGKGIDEDAVKDICKFANAYIGE